MYYIAETEKSFSQAVTDLEAAVKKTWIWSVAYS